MKSSLWLARSSLLASCILSLALFWQVRAQAQGASNLFSIITIRATDPTASFSGDPGVFTIFRDGPTNSSVDIFESIGGTASNGLDYAAIPYRLTIPPGVQSTNITILPINRGQKSNETVFIQLVNPPPIPQNYSIGYPSNATVLILTTNSTVTNIPPTVRIAIPTNGATFITPVDILICATATDSDGFVSTVEFFADTNSLGIRTNCLPCAGPANPFCLTWSNVPPGNYVLTAKATDNGGASTISAPVGIMVLKGPPTNVPPVVSIFTPTNHSTFITPVDIWMCASASDSDGSVVSVEFFANSQSLGIVSNGFVIDPLPGGNGPTGFAFCLTWSNAPSGPFALTAKATDNGGATTISAPVNITILQGPPPTNIPPVVRIISPPNGAMFRAPVNIPLYAYAHDPDGTISSVEFFAGTNDLGPGQGICGPIASPSVVCPTNIYLLIWSNAPLGTYPLTAVAADNGGASTVSEPVKVTIIPPPPPPTNRPPVVTIVATDPVAIEGTNCWTWPGMTNPTPTWAGWQPAACVLFENCGPKNATMLVRRFGVTNDDLSVNYLTGGTASNGVEYVTVPPSPITIPAGQHSVLITIVPLDDGPPDITSTVILKLVPSTNYFIGYPPAAAAIILDPPFPRAAACMLPGNCFHLKSSGPNGAWFSVEYTTDLLNWTPVCTNQVFNGSIDFIDPDSSSAGMRFYRAMPQSTPP